jgi:heterodisulfide reductase subunit A
MRMWKDDIRALEHEGVEIRHGWIPAEIVISESQQVTGVRLKPYTRALDEQRRLNPASVSEQVDELNCDMVLPAIGQKVDAGPLVHGTPGLHLTPRGTFQVDPTTLATERPGLFAGGDAVTGPALAIDAVAQGREAAESILRYLQGRDLREGRPVNTRGEDWAPIPIWRTSEPRAQMPELELEKRLRGFDEVELGFPEAEARREAARCIACGVCSECKLCVDACEAKAIDHSMKDELLDLDVGSIILATGFDPLDPTPMKHYGYGKYANVLTNLEFERLSNATGPTSGKLLMRDEADRFTFTRKPEAVAILHCIGSRDVNYHAYCSRTCCMYALKYAHLLKDKCGHDTQIYNFYIDMRCFGKGYEEFLTRVQREGVHMIRGKATRVTDQALSDEEKGKLIVIGEDTLSDRMLRVPVDMVILCTAMEPRADAAEVARRFGISVGADGFFLEEHPKLEPVSTPTSGVFLAGTCQGPKDIPDTVAQAKGAACEALALSASGYVNVAPMISSIDPEVCIGCQVCRGLCVYSAIEFDEHRGVSVVNEAICKGCGSCAAYCPSGAAKVRHFTDKQIFAEIEGLLAGTRT